MGRYRVNQEKRIAQIRNAIAEGVSSLEELVERTELKPNTIIRYRSKVKFPFSIPYSLLHPGEKTRRRPKIDELIVQGFTLEKMGEAVNLTRERIRQYIKATQKHEFWREKRKEAPPKATKKMRNNLDKRLLSVLEGRALTLAQKEGWAYQKSAEYYYVVSRQNRIEFSTLIKLFKSYETAKKRNKQLALEDFARETGISVGCISKIFRRVGVEPMYGNLERHITPQHIKDIIDRSLHLKISTADVAYFLGVSAHVVQERFQALGTRPKIKIDITRIKKETLTYRLASQIYESYDAEFREEEIPEIVDTNERLVRYALEHRKDIEPRIIEILNKLYTDQEICQPYLLSKKKSA